MKTQENKKSFIEIYNINVNDKVEQKGRFKYLSWSYAWAEIKKIDEQATFKVVENQNGLPFHYDSQFPKIGAFVKVEMTVNNITLTETHPVLDNANKSIAVENLNSFTINTSIKRALAKVASLHGLGLYIYNGEDLPESNLTQKTEKLFNDVNSLSADEKQKTTYQPKPASEAQIKLLKTLGYNGETPKSSMDASNLITKLKATPFNKEDV